MLNSRIIASFIVLLLAIGKAQAPVGLLQFAGQTQTPSAVVCVVTTGNCTGTGGGSSLFTAATCDGKTATTNVTIANGSPNLAVSSAIFAAGDVGKTINIAGAGSSGNPLLSIINTFTDSTHVVLANNAGTALVAQSEVVQWGHDDSTAFSTFNTWATGTWQAAPHTGLIELDIPHGGICQVLGLSNQPVCFANGIRNLLVVGLGFSGQGDGAAITDFNNIGNNGSYYLAAGGGAGPSCRQANQTGGTCNAPIWATIANFGVNGCESRIETVAAGASCVNLVVADAAQQSSGLTLALLAGRFTVGNYLFVTGVDMQANGFPANNYFFEPHQITSVSSSLKCDGATSGASVSLDAPLTFSYKSTWPLFFNGSVGTGDQGGPATIWALSPRWNASVEYRGLHLSHDGQDSTNIQSITFTNTLADGRFETFAGGGECFFPSQTGTFIVKNSDWHNCTLEVDKLNGSVTFSNSTVHKLQYQSSSVRTTIIDQGSVVDDLFGTGDKTICNNATLTSLELAPNSNGLSTEFDGTACTIGSITPQGVNFAAVDKFWTMSGGIITDALGRSVTARSQGNANGVGGCTGSSGNCVRLTLSCSACSLASTAKFVSGMSTYIQDNPDTGSCSTDVPDGTYTFNVIDGTHIDLVGTTYAGGTAVNTGCATLQATNNGFGFPPTFVVPGGNIMFIGSRFSGPTCQIADYTQDGDGIYITLTGTGCTGGFPNIPVTSTLQIVPNPMPVFNCTGCLGAGGNVFAGMPANKAYGEYASTILAAGNTIVSFPSFGTLVSLVYQITSTAGGETVDLEPVSFWIDATGTTVTSYNPPAESLSSNHTCTITPTTNVGCGAATAPGSALWALPGQVVPELNGGTAGSVTVTIQTNQHVVAGP